MEQLKEEQGKLLSRHISEILLRQNIRTAGRKYHAERQQRLPATSPVISQPTQPMNVDEETTQQATRTVPTSSIQQASQLNAEFSQRTEAETRRREDTSVNHRRETYSNKTSQQSQNRYITSIHQEALNQ